jgi:hypothetical protein
MEQVVCELRQLIDEYTKNFNRMSEADFSVKPSLAKWSKKEVLGHLIDSAQNNHRRFICGQYETVPPKIVYDQDFWVSANGYQEIKKEDIILHWKLINERIADVLTNMPAENYWHECDTCKQVSELHKLDWLAADYVKHMKHHINQIIPQSFNLTYP